MKTCFLTLVVAGLLTACIHTNQHEEQRFNTLNAELQYFTYANYDALIAFYHRLDSVCTAYPSERLHYLKKITEARINFREADYRKSLLNVDEATAVLNGLSGTDTLLANSLNLKGLNYMNMGIYDTAFLYFSHSVAMYDAPQHSQSLHAIWSNIARLFYNKGDYDRALTYINKATETENNTKVLLNALHLKANIFGTKGQLDSAMILDRQIIAQYNTPENR